MTATLTRAFDQPTPRELELLLDLTRQMAGGDHLEEVLDAVAEHFRQVVPFDRMEYSTLEGDGRALEVRWTRSFGLPDVARPGTRWMHRSPLTGDNQPRPFLILDLPEQARAEDAGEAVRLLVEAGYRSSIACPLLVAGSLDSIVYFNTSDPRRWNRRHLSLVELVVGHLEIAAARTRLTEELRRSNEELRIAQASRAEFIAAVSHEIRTPLTGIVGLAHTVSRRLDELARHEVEEFAGMIHQQAEEVTALVDDLLVAARMEAGALRVTSSATDLREQIDGAIESLGAAPSPAVDGRSATVLADPLRLRQVIRNLLTNAERHGGPDVRIDHGVDGDMAFVAVSDDGPGVPPDRQERMFTPFDPTGGGHAESVGLGLAVSRSLAEAMGGSLTYERRRDRTVFTLSIPLA
ncbi:MAG TPA: HAMP domain-containing sensor histidine kinase [Acidimicrobiia bacterium]|nr:HAMP domain-containing sensor histidine kinase [Acidimicrobiia bacterium]